MIVKTFEVRDRATFIPILAVKLAPAVEQDRYLLARAGYGPTPEAQAGYVLCARLAGGNGYSTCDPYDWDSRTMQWAHEFVCRHFDSLESGAVVDVEYIKGLIAAPKRSEADRRVQ